MLKTCIKLHIAVRSSLKEDECILHKWQVKKLFFRRMWLIYILPMCVGELKWNWCGRGSSPGRGPDTAALVKCPLSLSQSVFTQLYLMMALLQHSAFNSRAPAASDKYGKSNRTVFAMLLPDRHVARHRNLLSPSHLNTTGNTSAMVPLITASPPLNQYKLKNDRPVNGVMSEGGQYMRVNLG